MFNVCLCGLYVVLSCRPGGEGKRGIPGVSELVQIKKDSRLIDLMPLDKGILLTIGNWYTDPFCLGVPPCS